MSHTTTGFLKRALLLCIATALIGCAPAAAPQPPSATQPAAAAPTATPPMSLADAKQIASQSSCMQSGTLKDTAVYNPNSNTWWIDLDANAPGCNPACVVDVATKTAQVNWRCTGAGVPPAITPQAPGQVANPASEYCVKQGGTVSFQTRGDGGQYGVCMFEDNKQCEEWAMLRGDCPVGGIKVTGYVTPAAQYCAITGGTYAVTGNPNTPNETGTCTFKNGQTCDAGAYYNGTCVPGAAPTPATAATIQPLPVEVCNGQAQAMAHTLDVQEVTQSDAPLSDPVSGASGTGCQATVTGTGVQFKSPDAVVNELGSMLKDQGWTEDPMLAAGGPTGFGAGYRKGDQICMAAAQWWPDDSANCPKDQPVSTCQVTPEQQIYTVTLNSGVEAPPGGATATAGTANPASENCIKQGGTVSFQTRGDNGQYGVCMFEDNRQCEEWAMLRGDCPVGGIKVTGYVTPAAQYCAITGGTYAVTGNPNTENETGTCTFKNGQTCDAGAYYNGTCSSTSGSQTPAGGGSAPVTGNYTGQAPAADAIGRVLVLSLLPVDKAMLTTQYIGKGEPIVETGTWTSTGSDINVMIMNNPTMVFQLDNGTLVLQNAAEAGYGPNGLTLTRTPSGQTNTAEYGGVKIAFDAQLAQSAQGETLAAVPVTEGPALGGGSPAAIRFLFDGAKAENYFNPHLAQVLVYKADDWTKLDPSTAQTVANLKNLLATKPVSVTGSLPVLPPMSVHQALYAQAQYLNFQNGTGVGFVTYYTLSADPITASDLFYTFQGLTNDGKYYISVFHPVSTTLLPATAAMSGPQYEEFAKNYETYLTTLTAQLNELISAAYVPDLTLIEQLVKSIEVGDKTLE